MQDNKPTETPDMNRITKLIKKSEHKEQITVFSKYFKKAFSFAASFFFVVLISLSSAVVAFADVREAVTDIIYHLVFEENERYTVISVGETTGFIDPAIYDWEGAYAPTYMPKGFEYALRDDIKDYHFVYYTSKDKYIGISQFYNGMTRVDTEDSANKEQIIVNGSDAIIYEKDGLVSVSWRSGETLFWIEGNVNRDEIIKIAENMKILK